MQQNGFPKQAQQDISSLYLLFLLPFVFLTVFAIQGIVAKSVRAAAGGETKTGKTAKKGEKKESAGKDEAEMKQEKSGKKGKVSEITGLCLLFVLFAC